MKTVSFRTSWKGESSKLLYGTAAMDDEVDEPKKHNLSKEIRYMMYGFGDEKCPYSESIALIEDIVINYLHEISTK